MNPYSLPTFLGFIGNLRPTEVIVILLVILILFGAEKLPQLARSLGRSVREFKPALATVQADLTQAVDSAEKKPSAAPVAAEDLARSSVEPLRPIDKSQGGP